ncbi:MAG TPA: DUF4826 family protein [Allosphingosinicella sp.]|jgi:hypothetical protein
MADKPDYDDPDVEDAWCDEERAKVVAYVEAQRIPHRSVGDWPAWFIAPNVAVWALESETDPGWVGHWVISGDLPTDYVSRDEGEVPREAVRALSERWREAALLMERGEAHPDIAIGQSAGERKSLAPLLAARAALLGRMVDDEEIWADDWNES